MSKKVISNILGTLFILNMVACATAQPQKDEQGQQVRYPQNEDAKNTALSSSEASLIAMSVSTFVPSEITSGESHETKEDLQVARMQAGQYVLDSVAGKSVDITKTYPLLKRLIAKYERYIESKGSAAELTAWKDANSITRVAAIYRALGKR